MVAAAKRKQANSFSFDILSTTFSATREDIRKTPFLLPKLKMKYALHDKYLLLPSNKPVSLTHYITLNVM